MMFYFLIFILAIFHTTPVHAMEEQKFVVPDGEDVKWEEYDSKDISKEAIVSNIPDFVKTPAGGLAWDVLATTKEVPYKGKDNDGYDLEGTRPEFTESVKKIDKTQVKMQGYMFPLEKSEEQKKFLFGPFPITCPYHYHVGPSMVIEVEVDTPISFSYDPITISGTLNLVPRDDDFNVFYRLKQAKLMP